MDEFGLIVLLCIITFVIAIWSYLIGHDAGFKDGFYNGGMEHPALKSNSTLYEPPDEGTRPIDKEWEKALQKLRDAGEITDREYDAMRK